jgi:acyl carrier protein
MAMAAEEEYDIQISDPVTEKLRSVRNERGRWMLQL